MLQQLFATVARWAPHLGVRTGGMVPSLLPHSLSCIPGRVRVNNPPQHGGRSVGHCGSILSKPVQAWIGG